MEGRDPDESHRVATPLELLFDLTFVVAFGIAADEMAHYLAEDHIQTAILGFSMSAFAIVWAWINFSWFASAYDTDDWVYRLITMVQMVGVVILALGLAPVFESIDEGETVNNGVMVAGYVVMRIGMVLHWSRAARHDPQRRAAAKTYIVTILIAQAGWVILLFAHTTVAADVPLDRRARRRRVRRPVAGGAAQGRHAVAPAPHRRALRAAGDHRARRGNHRHDRVAGRVSGPRARAGRSTRRSSRWPASG